MLGEDEQFGGEKGSLLDPNLGLGLQRSGRKIVTKKDGKVVSEKRLNPEVSRKKDRKDPKKKNMGGMMKAKGKANGGMMKAKGRANGGAMKKKGYAAGGSANLKKAGADQKGLKKLPTAVRNKMGYMKDGGMSTEEKGYSKGGAATKAKRTSKRKSSMGAATRGGGAIMR